MHCTYIRVGRFGLVRNFRNSKICAISPKQFTYIVLVTVELCQILRLNNLSVFQFPLFLTEKSSTSPRIFSSSGITCTYNYLLLVIGELLLLTFQKSIFIVFKGFVQGLKKMHRRLVIRFFKKAIICYFTSREPPKVF